MKGYGKTMKIIGIVFIIFFCGVICFGQAEKINAGSTVYVAPMHGYESYVIAALQKKRVPVTVILDRYKADYIIGGSINHKDFAQPSVVVSNTNNVGTTDTPASRVQSGFDAAARRNAAARLAAGETSASISVLDPKTTAIVFSYATAKGGSKQMQRNAEDFAKHLKNFIEKQK